jgi:hypothetical protein
LLFFLLWIFFLKLIIIFMISFFNIKLVWNWVSWLSSGLKFHGLWVWKINPGLEDLSEFNSFVFFKLMFSQFHHSIFILMRIALRYFFYFLFIGIFISFENDMCYLSLFICYPLLNLAFL